MSLSAADTDLFASGKYAQSNTLSMSEITPRDTGEPGYAVSLEFISMMMVTTNSIVPNARYCRQKWHPVCNMTTQHEFLFKVRSGLTFWGNFVILAKGTRHFVIGELVILSWVLKVN